MRLNDTLADDLDGQSGRYGIHKSTATMSRSAVPGDRHECGRAHGIRCIVARTAWQIELWSVNHGGARRERTAVLLIPFLVLRHCKQLHAHDRWTVTEHNYIEAADAIYERGIAFVAEVYKDTPTFSLPIPQVVMETTRH